MLEKKIEETSHGAVLTLYGEATIQSASELKNIFTEQLDAHGSITMNLTYVTDCDLSFLQLLCAAHKRSAKEGKSVRIADRSPLVDDVASLSGFLRTSGCSPDINMGCLWQREKAKV